MVVDDQPIVRAGIRSVIRKTPGMTVCGDTGDISEAAALAEKTQPGVTLVGLCLLDGSAAKAIDQIRASQPETQFAIFSGHTAEEVLDARIPEVSAYLLKTSSIKELVKAIQAAAQDQDHFDAAIASAALDRFRNNQSSLRGPSKRGSPQLSPREVEVLRLLMNDFKNKKIATKLGVSLSTAERHVSNVLAKIGVDSRLKAVLWAVANLIDEPNIEGRRTQNDL